MVDRLHGMIRHVGIFQQLEFQERCALEQLTDLGFLAHPGQFDNNAGAPEFLNGRFGDTILIDTVSHDLHRAVDRLF
jgi:hypothetical protein